MFDVCHLQGFDADSPALKIISTPLERGNPRGTNTKMKWGVGFSNMS